jgi:hypothetical protein
LGVWRVGFTISFRESPLYVYKFLHKVWRTTMKSGASSNSSSDMKAVSFSTQDLSSRFIFVLFSSTSLDRRDWGSLVFRRQLPRFSRTRQHPPHHGRETNGSVSFSTPLSLFIRSRECVIIVTIRKISAHEGGIKGVVWDPVGQYLATQVS